MMDLAKPMSGLLVQPLGSKRVCANFSHSILSGTPCCNDSEMAQEKLSMSPETVEPSIAIDGDRLEAELPCLDVGFGDLFDRRRLGQIDCLRDRAGDEWLRRRHHLQVSHVSDGARALGRLERAIEYGEMLVFHQRRAF